MGYANIRRVNVGLAPALIVSPEYTPRRATVRLVAGPGTIGLAHDPTDLDIFGQQAAGITGQIYLLPLALGPGVFGADTFILAPGQGLYAVSVGAIATVVVEWGPWDPDAAALV